MLRSFALTSLALAAVFVTTPRTTHAATLTVTTGAELRDAIDDANSDSSITEIVIDAGSVTLTDCNTPAFGADLDNANISGDLDFTGSQALTIRGAGTERSAVVQACTDRGIDHHGAALLRLENLELNGFLPDVPIGTGDVHVDYSGGAVRNLTGSLALIDVGVVGARAGSASDSIASFGNARSPGRGGAIYSTGDVAIADSDLLSNRAGNGGDGNGVIPPTRGGSGGAIYARTGDVNITNSQLTQNSAGAGGQGENTPGADGGWGGAVYTEQSATINGSQIVLNRAGAGGDGLDHIGGDGGHAGGVYATNLVSFESVFNSNLAGDGGEGNSDGGSAAIGSIGGKGGNGGAVFAATSILTRSFITEGYAGSGGGSTLDTGGAGGHGGGIFGQLVNIVDSEIETSFAGYGGSSQSANGGPGGHGGAIAATSSIDATNSFFERNVAGEGGVGTNGGLGGDGGALSSARSTNTQMTTVGSTFDGNRSGDGGVDKGTGDVATASGRGGAVFNLNNSNGAVTAINSTFVRNEIGEGPDAVSTGSAIAADNVTLTMVTVTDNVGAHAIEWTGTGLGGFDFITASIIGDNDGGNCAPSGPSVEFRTQSGGYNVEDDDSCGFTEPSDLVDQPDLGLGPITDGPEPSIGLAPTGPDPDGVGRLPTDGGPLDDLIPAATCDSGFRLDVISTDQWGMVRPRGLGCEPGSLEIGVDPDPEPDPDPGPGPTPDEQLDAAARFVPLPPVRLFDTRSSEPAAGPKGVVTPDTAIDVQITGVGGVPGTAVAVVMNVAAINATDGGFVTIWAAGDPQPLAATHNLTAPGQTRPNLVTVPIGADGKVSIYTQRGSHFAGDVAGYYEDIDIATAEGRVVSVQPGRLFDTRPTETVSPGPKGVVGADSTIDVQITGVAGVPTVGVAAVVMNLAGINATGKGFVTAYPAGETRPLAAVLNLNAAGDTNSNLVMVPVGADGKVSLYSSSGTHLSGDVTAYITDDLAGSGTAGLFVPLAPTRAFDTRPGEIASAGPKGFVGADTAIDGAVGSAVSIPTTASAAVLNVAGVNAAGKGFVTGYPAGTVRPLSATLNLAEPGDVRPNAAILPIGTDDSISFYSQSGTHLVVDTSGYFLG